MRVQFILVLLLFLITGCDREAKGPVYGHNSRNSLDWAGTYQAILPCASGSGMKKTLILNSDNSYKLQTTYLLHNDQIFEHKGHFKWHANGNRIILEDIINSPIHYQVGEGKLIQLDMSGQKISGSLSENYILKKIN